MYYSSELLEKLVTQVVGENLDWFFKRVLHDLYERRRQNLRDSGDDIELLPAIDYVLRTCVDEDSQYPPATVSKWYEYFLKLGSGYSHVFQQLLIIYLELDISTHLSVRERESKTGRQTRSKDKAELAILDSTLTKLRLLPFVNDFPRPLVKLATGLWAMDNDQPGLMINCLSDPLVQLGSYFETPKELVRIITGTLQQSGNPRLALYMSRVHRHEHWDEEYDQMYAYLLLSSGQLVEALRYERMFTGASNYREVLHHFFGACSKLDITRSLNVLNLSVEEEEALNQHLVAERSQTATPASGVSHQTRRVIISEPNATPTNRKIKSSSSGGMSTGGVKTTGSGGHTPRNRSVQQLKRMPSFNDSPARNTRSARKKKTAK